MYLPTRLINLGVRNPRHGILIHARSDLSAAARVGSQQGGRETEEGIICRTSGRGDVVCCLSV